MKESDKKKIGEAYLRLHSCNENEGMTNAEVVEELNADLKEVNFWLERYKSNGEVCEKREIRKVVLEAAIKALEQTKWIPVSERLPNAYEFVNCTCHSLIDDRENWVIETVYIPQPSDSPYSDWGNIPMLNSGDCKVVAWMHRDIPEPYKAESEDNK